MKRQKQIKQQEIFNKCQVEKVENTEYYKIKKVKGKTIQKIISETKFKEIQTKRFPPWCLDKELTAALIQLERIENIDDLNTFINPMVIVYKHVLSNGYKTRPISDNLIGIIDLKNHESCIKIVTSNDLLTHLFINENRNEVNQNHIEHISVVQNTSVVFLSLNQFI